MTASRSLIVYLFVKGEPTKKTELMKYFGLEAEALAAVLTSAREALSQLSLTLIDDGKTIELRTAPEAQDFVEKIRKEELGQDIGKAGLETLAIVLYKGAASRAEIDYIRGVNSSHILRALSMRGLVRRIPKPGDERSFLYEPTTDLLAHFSVSNVRDLPEYAAVQASIAELERVQPAADLAKDTDSGVRA